MWCKRSRYILAIIIPSIDSRSGSVSDCGSVARPPALAGDCSSGEAGLHNESTALRPFLGPRALGVSHPFLWQRVRSRPSLSSQALNAFTRLLAPAMSSAQARKPFQEPTQGCFTLRCREHTDEQAGRAGVAPGPHSSGRPCVVVV